MKMKKKVTIRTKSGGAFQLPLYQEEITRLLKLCDSRKSPDMSGMFDINTLVSDEQDIHTQIWVRLKEIDCVIVEPLTNISVPPKKEILAPGA